MSSAIAYGTFVKYGTGIYRSATYIQWGNSENLIGACVLCNPGIAVLEARGLYIHGPINEGREFTGVIKPDEAVKGIIKFVEQLYKGEKLEGTLYIYNLFSLLDAPFKIFQSREIGEQINKSVLYRGYTDFIVYSDRFPWVLLAWGCDNRSEVYAQKIRWLNYINKNKIPFFGVEAVEYPGYLQPRQQEQWRSEKYIEDLIRRFRLKNLSLQVSENKSDDIISTIRDVKRLKTTNRIFNFIHEKKAVTVEELLRENIKLMEEKQFKKVITNCIEALKLDNKCLSIYVHKSQALEATGDSLAAVKILGELLVRTKDVALQDIYDAKVAEYHSENEKAIGNYRRAIDTIKASDNLNVNNPEVLTYLYNSLGKLLSKMESYEEALDCFDKSLEIRDALYTKELRKEAMLYLGLRSRSMELSLTDQLEFDGAVKEIEINLESIPIKEQLEVSDETEDEAQPCENNAWEQIKEKLDSLIGLNNVKRELFSIMNYLNYERNRSQILNLEEQNLSYHFMFTGNPGTGKTTVARLLGEILVQAGVLQKGHLVEVDRSKIVGQYVGQTAVLTRKAIESAMDGILFIDEAYSLYRADSPNDYGVEAIDTLVKAMEDYRGKFVVIFAGYSREINKLMQMNPGLKSRVNVQINFEDYTDDELLLMGKRVALEKHYEMDEGAECAFIDKICRLKVDSSFANGRTVRNIIEDAIREKAYRIGTSKVSEEELKRLTSLDFGRNINSTVEQEVSNILDELNNLVGLSEVKTAVKEILDYMQLQNRRRELGFKNEDMSLNMIFTGNPGTGKTTIARLISRLFKESGILKRGQLVEVTREDLVGEYIGQTSAKTLDKVKEAYGGVLFIDEAYSLAQGGDSDYGREAIATLIKEMEDNRDKLMVIMAGYTEEMDELLNLNTGLRSRIGFTIQFPDYKPEELLNIFKNLCESNDYKLDSAAEILLKDILNKEYMARDKSFGNGRLVRQLFEKARMRQANRVMAGETFEINPEDIITINSEDLK